MKVIVCYSGFKVVDIPDNFLKMKLWTIYMGWMFSVMK